MAVIRSISGVTSYEPTQDDILWLLRAVDREGQPHEIVAQTLINGFVWARERKGWSRTLGDFVRAYAQPVNPLHFPDGEKFREAYAAATEPQRQVLLDRAERRRDVYSRSTSFQPRTKAAVERALTSGPVLPEATDYAAPWVEKRPPWKPHGPPEPNKNRFWTRPEALQWTGYRVQKKNELPMNTASVMERLNNNIVAIDWHTSLSRASEGVKRSIGQLAQHWVEFWNSTARQALPPLLLRGRLERYAEWYARAYVLVPADVRTKVLNPALLDPSTSALVEESVRQAIDVYGSAAEAAKQLASDIAMAPAKMAEDVARGMARGAADEMKSAVMPLVIGGVALVVLMRKR